MYTYDVLDNNGTAVMSNICSRLHGIKILAANINQNFTPDNEFVQGNHIPEKARWP